MKVNEIITNKILETLEKGTIPWKRSWYRKGTPMNMETKREYSGINLFLLDSPQYDYNYYMTFAQVQKAGGTVKKGSKSDIAIFYKMLEIEEKKNEEIEEKQIPLLRFYHLFNIANTNLEIPKELLAAENKDISNNYTDSKKWLKAVVKKFNLKLKFEGDQPAFYPQQNLIRIPKMKYLKSINDFWQVIFHEIGHYLDWHIRRKETGEIRDKKTYSFNELTAEMFSCFMMNRFKLEISEVFNNSADYIKGWLSVLKDDSNMVITASRIANKLFEEVKNN
jgi:antirestriction protein ArdC